MYIYKSERTIISHPSVSFSVRLLHVGTTQTLFFFAYTQYHVRRIVGDSERTFCRSTSIVVTSMTLNIFQRMFVNTRIRRPNVFVFEYAVIILNAPRPLRNTAPSNFRVPAALRRKFVGTLDNR